MKKALRLISVILCLVMVVSTFYGCTIAVEVDIENKPAEGGAVQVDNTVAPSAPVTQTPATTQAPASTQAPSEASSGAASSEAAKPSEGASAESKPAANAAPTTKEEIVAEYVKVYNTTKAAGTLLGSDAMSCESVTVDGKEQSLLRSVADKFMTANAKDMQLPPYTDADPGKECKVTADDIETAEYKDNGDGTATIKIVPKEVKNSRRFADAQGKVFNVMEDVVSALANVSVLTWSEGDANSNVILTEKDGYAEVTYNKDTKMMTSAEYVLITYADVTHANVMMFKDKAAGAKFVYTTKFPQE